MDQIDNAINSLSSDELDTLNADPKMQADFKAKYSESQDSPLVHDLKLGFVKPFVEPMKDLASNLAILPNALKTASQLGGEALAAPAELAQGIARGNIQPPTVAKDIQSQVKSASTGLQEGVKNFVGNPVKTVMEHPFTTAAVLSGAGETNEVLRGLLPSATDSQVAEIMQKTTSIPERATKYSGIDEPMPTKFEIDTAIKNVQKSIAKVVKEHGDLLNAAKSELGIPTTLAEKEDSLMMNGNPHGLGKDNINTESSKMLDAKTPEELASNIAQFKAQALGGNSDKALQGRFASALQDKINNFVDWNKTGNDVQGVLKQQYKDLRDMVADSSPKLQEAKAKWSGLQDNLDNISKKLSKGPGTAEAYLRRLFTSNSPAVEDDINALTKIEHLSGQPVLTELFKKFAGEAYGKVLSQSSHTLFSAPYALLTSPKYAVTPAIRAAQAMAKLPAVGTTGIGIRALKTGFPLSVEDKNRSALQSVRDRLTK